ncbi:MAG: COX15/CtaA family protein [Alphaproteobacteria bacterium]|nr:COX15/CtaA family protein [Alphaproteobacteria bacterium]
MTNNRHLIIWLIATAILIWLMIILGGVTRLTHSGLSIVEWKPITGIIPPITEPDWQKAFTDYKNYPEFKLVNYDMALKDFKFIYLMEYSHRLLGRLIGLVFLIPLVIFWKSQKLNLSLKRRSLMILALGILQGFMGWYMVKSGLVKDPSVSHYRLTLHLALAFWLLGLVLWSLLEVIYPQETRSRNKLIWVTFVFQLITMTYGGLVAGLKAGLIYNTFPLMEGKWIPFEWSFYKPIWINFFENAALVQWCHRVLAIVSLCLVWLCYFTSIPLKRPIVGFWAWTVTIQAILGIFTLLYQVPVALGTLHQGFAVVVFGMGILCCFQGSCSVISTKFSTVS